MQFTIDIEIFDSELYVYFGMEELTNYVKDTKLKYSEIENADGCNSGNMMWLPDRTNLQALVHEVIHAADLLMNRVGIGNDMEVRAYLADYIFEKCLLSRG